MNGNPGELITFGRYPQRAGGTGGTPIAWRVLRNSGTELFVLSEYILDCRRYHGEHAPITWRDCALRQWLNDDFFHVAFHAAEQDRILSARCTGNGENSPDTHDRVFLLSAAEARELTVPPGVDAVHVNRGATGTEYARVKKDGGCRLYVYDKKMRENYITRNGEVSGCSWWWLRTRGNASGRAFFIGTRGSIRSYGQVNLAWYGVRPAMYLAVQSPPDC
jgi:hypothetical protein